MLAAIADSAQPVALYIQDQSAGFSRGGGARAGLRGEVLRAPYESALAAADAVLRLVEQLKMPVGGSGIAGQMIAAQNQRVALSGAAALRQRQGDFQALGGGQAEKHQ